MGAFLTYVFPALLPALTDGLRGVIAKLTGGAGGQPQNMQERVALMQAETSRLEALAKLDAPVGDPSKWVVNIRAVFRYAAITLIWIITAVAILSGADRALVLVLLDMCGASLSFIIGERFYLKLGK